MTAVYGLIALVIVLQIAIAARIEGLNRQLNRIVDHLGLRSPGPSERVKRLADDPALKIEAIKAYREETGAGLKEAKDVVEQYLATRGS